MVTPLASPEKELRFTRSAQAVLFGMLAAVFFAAGIILLASAIYRHENPFLPHPLWAILPFGITGFLIKAAIRLTRHAYLILTPLGIEVFPFFRPAKGMQLISWHEIHDAEIAADEKRLTLHFNPEKTAGIHFSLRPIRKDRRSLLAKAVLGRISRRGF